MTPYYEHAGITIYHGDCRQVIPHLQPVDLLLTDPPYGIGDKWTQTPMVGKRGSSRLWGRGETWDDSTVPVWILDQAMDHAKVRIGGFCSYDCERDAAEAAEQRQAMEMKRHG